MAGQDDGTEDLDRLEQALSRIESVAATRPAAPAAIPPEALARLDAVIGRLRAGLDA